MNNLQKKQLRINQLKRRIASAGILFLLAFAVVIAVFNSTDTKGSVVEKNKYFTSIKVEKGNTLWSIAQEYICDESTDIKDYVDEIKSMNNITSDTIHAGNYIVVYYYK